MSTQVTPDLKAVQTIVPQNIGIGATVNGAAVDCAGFDEAMIVFDVGVVAASGTIDTKIQESVDSAFTSPLDITGAVFVQVTPANDNAIYIGTIKMLSTRLQFLRAVAVDAVAAGDLSVSIHLGQSWTKPSQTPAFSV